MMFKDVSRSCFLVAVFLVGHAVAHAQTPEKKQTPTLCYEKADTWFDSMIASREQLLAEEQTGQREPLRVAYHSEIVRELDPAVAFSLDTHGAKELYLYVIKRSSTSDSVSCARCESSSFNRHILMAHSLLATKDDTVYLADGKANRVQKFVATV